MAALSQIIASTYPVVLNNKRKPTNQWGNSSFLQSLDKHGFVERKAGGASITVSLDSVINPGADIMNATTTPVSVTFTDVIAGASYTPANVVVPINVSYAQEAQTNGENEMFDLAAALATNAIDSHDRIIEVALFTTVTDGLYGLATHFPSTGQPNVGGIDGASIAYWRSYADTYLADGSDIEAALWLASATASKGTGNPMVSLIVSGIDGYTTYGASLANFQRFETSETADGGFKNLKFLGADFVFSNAGGTIIYGFAKEAVKLYVVRNFWRKLMEKAPMTAVAGTAQHIFSQCQFVLQNPSRGFALAVA